MRTYKPIMNLRTILAGSLLSTAMLLTPPASVLAQIPYFQIATNSSAMSFAFDGSNCLVGLENHLTNPTTIGAQMISSDGKKVGALIPTGRSGIAAAVAFGGDSYLMIWEDDGLGTLNGSTGWKVYGQFISRAGAVIGSPFPITTAGIWFDGVKTLAFGGGVYLVTYTRLINPAYGSDSSNRYIAGRTVSPSGIMGDEFRISTGFGAASDVAFDGRNFFVVWREDFADSEIRGRFVSPGGLVGTEVSVNASSAPSDNPESVVFDGTNYLVAWNDEVDGAGTGTWDAFGQLVSTTGALVGSRIPITTEPGPQMLTTVAFDGSKYLAVWIDMGNGTNWDVFGRYLSRDGDLLGDKISIRTDSGNQMGGGGFANGKFFVLVNEGIIMGEGGVKQVDAATGLFLAPLPTSRMENNGVNFGVRTNQFGFAFTGTIGSVVVIEAATNLVNPIWSPVGTNTLSDGSSYFSDPRWNNFPARVYRLRTP